MIIGQISHASNRFRPFMSSPTDQEHSSSDILGTEQEIEETVGVQVTGVEQDASATEMAVQKNKMPVLLDTRAISTADNKQDMSTGVSSQLNSPIDPEEAVPSMSLTITSKNLNTKEIINEDKDLKVEADESSDDDFPQFEGGEYRGKTVVPVSAGKPVRPTRPK
ncbi:hypothetical protein B0H34DRAFT_714181 [Crassisporium funariophilum]|nr:hypothetical protein B0H34DRAFT_714181 [Crassisporium funariophilum]